MHKETCDGRTAVAVEVCDDRLAVVDVRLDTGERANDLRQPPAIRRRRSKAAAPQPCVSEAARRASVLNLLIDRPALSLRDVRPARGGGRARCRIDVLEQAGQLRGRPRRAQVHRAACSACARRLLRRVWLTRVDEERMDPSQYKPCGMHLGARARRRAAVRETY